MKQPITIADLSYDGVSNKTHAFVETLEFSQWFWISGRLNEAKFATMIRPTVERLRVELGKGVV